MTKPKKSNERKKTKKRTLSRDEKDLKKFLIDLGQMIEHARKEQGKTQAAMINSGIDLRSWGRFVAGERDFRMSTLIKICKALKCQPADVLQDTKVQF